MADDKRTNVLHIRMSDREHVDLTARAQNAHRTVSDYVRILIRQDAQKKGNRNG
jgi:hypothetical protein